MLTGPATLVQAEDLAKLLPNLNLKAISFHVDGIRQHHPKARQEDRQAERSLAGPGAAHKGLPS